MSRPLLQHRVISLLVASAGFAACGDDGVQPPVLTTIRVSPSSVSLDALGASVTLEASAVDQYGNAVLGLTFSWESQSTQVAIITSEGTVWATGVGSGTVSASSSGVTSAPIPVEVNQVPTQIDAASELVELSFLGEEHVTVVRVKDSQDRIIVNWPVEWTTADASVASVSQSGAIGAVAPGNTTVTACATTDLCTSIAVTVTQIVTSITITPNDLSLTTFQETSQLSASAMDAGGALIPGATFAWSSDHPLVASVDEDGNVSALDDGLSRVQAFSGGVASPSILVTVILSGQVTIVTDSLPAGRMDLAYTADIQVIADDGTETWSVADGSPPRGLSLDPVTGTLAGIPAEEGVFAFIAQVQGATGPAENREFAVRICPAPLGLEAGATVGASIMMSAPDSCGILIRTVPGARFRVGIMATDYRRGGSRPESVPGGLTVRAFAGAEGGVQAAPPQLATRLVASVRVPNEGDDLADRTERLHRRLQEEEMALYGGITAPVLGPPLRSSGLDAARAPAPTARTFNIRDPETRVVRPVLATLRGESDHIIYYEDNAVQGTDNQASDDQVHSLLDYYERVGHQIIDNTFGGLGPVGTTDIWADGLRDTRDLDDNGKVIVFQLRPDLMSEGAAAFVTSCDRFPLAGNERAGWSTTCARSNEGEVTYFAKPRTNFYKGTLVHEVKHISSHGWAVYGGRGFNPSWIEEGTADLAKEKSSRDASGLSDEFRANTDDVRPDGAATEASYGMSTVLSRANRFLSASPLSAVIGNPAPNPNRSTIYGASWLFHRYLASRYAAADEDTFFWQLNVEGSGVDQLESVTGQSISTLFQGFLEAIGHGGRITPELPANRFTTYDMQDLATRWLGNAWPPAVGTLAPGTSVTIPLTYFTSPTFLDLEADSDGWVRLDVVDASGGVVDAESGVVMSVVRVQ